MQVGWGREGGRRRIPTAIGGFLGGALVLALAGPASAGAGQEDDEEEGDSPATTVEIEVGVDGQAELGDHVVVRVVVSSTELVDGEVVAGFRNAAFTVRELLQVPAGTTKELAFLLPVLSEDRVEVEVRQDGGDVVAESAAAVRIDDEVETVGLLPQMAARSPDLPDSETIASDTGRIELAPIPLDVLDLGPLALDAYDTVVAAGDDLGALTDDQRRAVLLWVNAGGRLLFDDAGSIDALPEDWRPAARSPYAWAGRGEVRLVDGAASAGRWATIIEPTGTRVERLDGSSDVFVDPEFGLAARAGFELPNLMPLIVVLLVYGFVIGPVVYLLLRRRRRLTWGWVVIPLLAAVTAGGIVVAGDRYRSAGHPATSTFVDASAAGSLQLSSVLTISRSGGTQTILLPATWHPLPYDPVFGGRSVPATLEPEADGTARHEQRLEAGQVVTGLFSGVGDRVGLSLTAEVAGTEIAGLVTNDTASTLHDVAVFAGNDSAALGSLAPGATAEWSVPVPELLEPFAGRAGDAWAMPFDGPGAAGQLVDWGVFGWAAGRWEMYPTGLARVVGWSTPRTSAVDAGDDATHVEATSALAPISTSGPPTTATIRAIVTRSPLSGDQFGDPFAGGEDVVMRYLLPPGADAVPLVVRPPAQVADADQMPVEFWDGEEWVDGDAVNDEREITVPPQAIRDGIVLARVTWTQLGDPSLVPTLTSAGGS